MRVGRKLVGSALIVGLAACDREPSPGAAIGAPGNAGSERETVSLAADWDATLPRAALERGRLDPAWMRVVRIDDAALEGDSVTIDELWDQISYESVNSRPMGLPLHGGVAGPSVVRAQVLLDRVLFSPGIIDGHWGKNTAKAVYWFQAREGLSRTGRLDAATFERLTSLAGGDPALIRTHRLTEDDVAGPFVSIPEDIYEKAELDCMCYESLAEKLAERFHTSVEMLEQLNPGTDLDTVTAGTTLWVPAVRDPEAARDVYVARLVVSGEGFYVHALDENGRILFHFPSTLGSSYDPSPEGDHRVTRITRDPWWHYQPSILAHVDDDQPEAKIPPGPNNAVGVVWMSLSIPHYGIHGTAAPETIGYTTSAGCVRLTNWDATFLSQRIRPGIPVEFTGTRS